MSATILCRTVRTTNTNTDTDTNKLYTCALDLPRGVRAADDEDDDRPMGIMIAYKERSEERNERLRVCVGARSVGSGGAGGVCVRVRCRLQGRREVM